MGCSIGFLQAVASAAALAALLPLDNIHASALSAGLPSSSVVHFSAKHATSRRRQQPVLPLRAIAENTIRSGATTFPDADESEIAVVSEPQAPIPTVRDRVVVHQERWQHDFNVHADDPNFANSSSHDNADVHDGSENHGQFPGKTSNGDVIIIPSYPSIVAELNDSDEISEENNAESNPTQPDDCEPGSSEGEEDSSGNDKSDESAIRSAMAKSILLHRAGIAGTAKTRSTGRSSKARTHVNKSTRGSSSPSAVGKVLGTVRTAAAAAAVSRKKSSSSEGESDENASGANTNAGSDLGSPFAAQFKNAVQSTVSDILSDQDFAIQQESIGATSYPPGTVTMGLLGEVVQDKLPDTLPLPGKFLVGTNGDIPAKPQISIRASIPHSLDDKHIANLRLSVFSRFDEEQQRVFRSRSLEVLNVRRRRGAVVLVAEVPNGWNRLNEHQHCTEMDARIAGGHEYGVLGGQPSLTVTPGRGARVTSVSPGIVVNDSMPQIIGSVECSHQEFRGTMLGKSRPKGSLMYVTEVAVKTGARRCGAGAMLMKGVDRVAELRNVESIYLHVDVTNHAACAMYERCGYHYLDKREPIYAQFTASLNLHDGAMHGRRHFLMCKHLTERPTWVEDDDFFSTGKGALGLI